MFLVKLEDTEYAVRFHYETKNTVVTHQNGKTTDYGPREHTTCRVSYGPVGTPPKEMDLLGEFTVSRNPLDRHNKGSGMRESLTKAVSSLPKEVRTAIWLAYQNTRGKRAWQ